MLYTIDLDKGAAVGKVPIDAPTGCAAALGKDRVFVGNEDNQFLAIDLAKGAIAWRFQDRERPMPYRSSAAVTADGIYVGSRDKKLHAFDPQTGRTLWDFSTRGMIDSSPVVVGGAPGGTHLWVRVASFSARRTGGYMASIGSRARKSGVTMPAARFLPRPPWPAAGW